MYGLSSIFLIYCSWGQRMARVFSGDVGRREWLLVASIVVVVGLTYAAILFRYPLMYGIDGPYYLIQVRSILQTGLMSYADPPFCFYFFSLLTLTVGDLTTAVKLGTVLFCALTVISTYLIGKRLTSSVPAAVTTAIVASLSPDLIVLSGEFVKNAVGSFFLLSFVYLCLRLLEGDESKATWLAAVLAFGLTGLTHILDLGLAVLYLALMTLFSLVSGLRKRSFLTLAGALVVGSAVVGSAAYFVYAGYTIDIGKGLTFIRQFLESLESYEITDTVGILGPRLPAYLSVAAGVVSSVLYYRRGRRSEAVFLASATLALLLMNFPSIPSQWAWRFALMTFVPMSSILGSLVGLIGERDVQFGVTAILLLFFVLTQTLPGSQRPRPTLRPEEYRDMLAMARYVPPGSKVVVGHGGRYWAEYLLNSQLFRPSPGEPINYPVYFVSGPAGPSPPQNSALLYKGEALSLYVTRPRSRS